MKTTTLFTNPINRWPLLPEISPFLRVICFVLLLTVVLTLSAPTSRAGSATGNLNPTNGDWNSAVNWTPPTVPNGPADTATSDRSNTTAVSAQTTEVDGIVFNAGASAFAVTTNPNHSLTFDGAGITNSSSVTQNFVTAVNAAGGWGTILFVNSATAGNTTTFTNQGGITNSLGGILQFSGNSNANTSTIINNGGASPGAGSGIVLFLDSSSAGDSAITNNAASVSGGFLTEGGQIEFDGNATAANSAVTNNGGANASQDGSLLQFRGSSTAGNAILIAKGGSNGGGPGRIWLFQDSLGGTARVEVFGDGSFDISAHHPSQPPSIGSIEGDGIVFLGAKKLRVGSNNRDTTFSGIIQDGGVSGDAGGSLTKIGTGRLVLTNANTYTGGTTINDGTLLVNHKSDSGTGSGAVKVNAGTLGGTGKITGAVTVGTGTTLEQSSYPAKVRLPPASSPSITR